MIVNRKSRIIIKVVILKIISIWKAYLQAIFSEILNQREEVGEPSMSLKAIWIVVWTKLTFPMARALKFAGDRWFMFQEWETWEPSFCCGYQFCSLRVIISLLSFRGIRIELVFNVTYIMKFNLGLPNCVMTVIGHKPRIRVQYVWTLMI